MEFSKNIKMEVLKQTGDFMKDIPTLYDFFYDMETFKPQLWKNKI